METRRAAQRPGTPEAIPIRSTYGREPAWDYDPVLGGINSLIQSGKLGIIQNDSLRVAIAGWPDIVQDLNGDENQQQTNTFERLRPCLMTRGVMFDVLMAGGRLEEILAEVETVDLSIQRILQLIETSHQP